MPEVRTRHRIAVFLQDLAGGGAERVMLNLAEGLANAGHEVDLVLVRRSGPFVAHIPPSLNVVELGTRRTLRSIPRFRRYLRSARPDAVISALPHVNIVAVVAAAMTKDQPVTIVTEHIQVSIDAQNSEFPLVRLAYRLARVLYRRASHVVAVSEGMADDLAHYLRMPRERILVIHNPVVSGREGNEPVPAHHWFVGKRAPVILGVGRLTKQKNFHLLLEAFALLRGRGICSKLLILGEGHDRPSLEARVRELGLSDDVQLPGFVTDPGSYMRHSDVFVLSSSWEALPTVLVEALARDTPVIATDCPSGPREILASGMYGTLVPRDDAEALCDALYRQLTVAEEGRRPGRERAAAFSTEAAVRRYVALLET